MREWLGTTLKIEKTGESIKSYQICMEEKIKAKRMLESVGTELTISHTSVAHAVMALSGTHTDYQMKDKRRIHC